MLHNYLTAFLSDMIGGLLERIRIRLAGPQAQLLLALLGLISGLLAGVVIISFRLLVESSQKEFLTNGGTENYEALGQLMRFILPIIGGLLVGLLLYAVSRQSLRLGVLHVMEWLSYHEGHLPLRNAVLQFVCAAISLICGHSVGREGPSIHLGAASASLLGQQLALPNNSIRTLVACGSAAAIGASFNTPLAGVIFSMEVVMMEYTIAGFIPVILAAVSATTLNQLVFGAAPVFLVPRLELYSLGELPLIVAMGILIGGFAALFITMLNWLTEKVQTVPIWLRTSLAGFLVGLCALLVPQIMGIGYDTINNALLGDLSLRLLLLIVVFKLIATVISIGMGLPGGLIGPTLVIGAAIGGTVGLLAADMPGDISHPGLYAMLGMGAMMGATLQAPLAALLALLELTANPHIILPAMLAIVSANLATKELFGRDSVYLSQMRASGLDFRNDPVSQSLRRVGVASVMDRSIVSADRIITKQLALQLLKETPRWVIIEGTSLMPAADLARYIEETESNQIDLMECPSQRRQLGTIHLQATLQEALEVLDKSEAEALSVTRPTVALTKRFYGVVSRQDIEQNYRMRR